MHYNTNISVLTESKNNHLRAPKIFLAKKSFWQAKKCGVFFSVFKDRNCK